MSKKKKAKPTEFNREYAHDPEVENSVKLFKEEYPKYTPVQIGFIRKNNIKDKTASQISDMLRLASKSDTKDLLGCGDLFSKWCKRFGRPAPSADLVASMNADPAEANMLITEALQTQPTVFRSYCTYLSGRS